MPLNKQTITVPVNALLDTKSDAFLTDAQNALTQENVRFYQTGALVKRPGFAQLESTISDPDPLSLTAKRVLSDNNQLYALGGTGPENVQTWLDGWITFDGDDKIQSNVVPGQIKLRDTFGGDKRVDSTWLDYHDGKYALVINEFNETGAITQSYPSTFVYDGEQAIRLSPAKDIILSAGDSYNRVRCAILDRSIFGNVVVIAGIYTSGGADQLRITAYDINLTTRLFVQNTTIAAMSGEVAISADAVRTSLYVSVRSGPNSVRIFRIGDDGSGTIVQIASTTITTVATIVGVVDIDAEASCVLCVGSTSLPVVLQYAPGTLALEFEYAVPNESTIGLDAIVEFLAGSIWSRSGIPVVGWSIRTATNIQTSISLIQPDVPSSTPLAADYGIRLSGKGYSDANKSIVPLLSSLRDISNTSQTCVFSIAQFGNDYSDRNNTAYIANAFIERVLMPAPGKITSFPRISTTFPDLSGLLFGVAPTEITRVISYDGISGLAIGATAKAAVSEFDYNQNDKQYGSEINLADSLMIYGANPSRIDPGGLFKLSLPIEPVFSAAANTVDGSLAAGTYLLNIYFETTDERGNVIYSPIGEQVSVTTTGSTSIITLTIRVNRQMSGCVAAVFCTQANGNTLQLVEKVGFDDSVGSFTYVIERAPLATAPIIYTAGGVLESTGCAPAAHASIHNDRVFIVPADEFNKIYYSNKYVQGEVPSFSNLLFLETANSTPRYRDRIIATQGIGDKLVIFRENSIYWVAGDGANLLGVNQSFTEPEALAQDIGCKDSRSVVLTPGGIMFKSDKGIYLIDGGLSLSYVGAAVETYNAESIIDTCLITQRNIVLMLTASRILCFDYLQQRWSVDTVSGLASLAIWQNKIVALKASGRLSVESTAFVDDFGEMTPPSIQMKLVTGWIKLTGIQDFGRIYRLLILGRYYSAHTLTVKVYYDYNDAYVETFTITPNPEQGTYQFKIHLAKQKCESIKVEVFDTGSGQSLDLTGMTLEVGTKVGSFKGNTNKQY